MKKVGRSGFTLFELLVTLSVISMVLGIGFYSIARGTDDRALEKGADILHSMVRVARTQAITNGVHARLIINADVNDPDSYLRRIGVVIEDEEEKYWIAVDRGASLPKGVFLVPQGNNIDLPEGWPEAGRRSIYKKQDVSDKDSAIYKFEYPLKKKVLEDDPDSIRKWICIQFAPNGRLSSCDWGGGYISPSNNQLVIAKGLLSDGGMTVVDKDAFIGIAFKQNGSSYETKESKVIDE